MITCHNSGTNAIVQKRKLQIGVHIRPNKSPLLNWWPRAGSLAVKLRDAAFINEIIIK